jgi:RNA 2',3'-cyclic 3'-phosphodiesterase
MECDRLRGIEPKLVNVTERMHFMRIFIAIEIPDELKKKICRLRVDIPGARWVPAEQIHLTLAFLGEVEEATIELLNEGLAGIQLREFHLSFSGTGCFPNRHRPRVLWLGVEPEPHLEVLADRAHTAVHACGIPLEERRFSPHITLARLKLSPSRESDAFLNQTEQLKLPPFPVREFTLFESRLTSKGAEHIPLREFRLRANDIK